jgi:hypothetical protein
MSDGTSKYLPIYLNDHLTASTFALELAGRAAGENRGSELGDFLAGLRLEIETDRRTLQEIMASLGVAKDPLKRPVGWIAEKLGRLKLNGSLLSYSPLSRLEEIEGLSLGVDGKLGLWQALKVTHGDDPRLRGVDLDALITRARSQRRRLERQRRRAAQEALR